MRVLCVDIGTSRAKAAVYRDHPSGVPERVSLVSRLARAVRTDGRVDLDLLRQDLLELLGSAAAETPLEKLDALAVTCIYGHVLTDHRQLPCGPGLAWNFDPGPVARSRLDRRFGPTVDGAWGDALRGPGPDTLATRLAWLAAGRPHEYAAAVQIAGLKDWLIACLTGVWAADPTLRDYLGAPPDQLAALCEEAGIQPVEEESPLARAGSLLPGPAAGCGLRPGIPVIRACTDGSAAMYGLGVLAPGLVTAVTGSTDVVMTETPRRPERPAEAGGGATRSAVGTWLRGGSTASSGAAIHWLDELLAPAGRSWWEVAPGSEGVVAGAGLGGERAPFQQATPAFLRGLRAGHDGAVLQRAMREAVCMRFSLLVGGLAAPGARRLVVGGGSQEAASPGEAALEKLRASLSPLPMERARDRQSSLLGLALLAFSALDPGDPRDVLRRRSLAVAEHTEPVPDDAGLREQYADLMPEWRQGMEGDA